MRDDDQTGELTRVLLKALLKCTDDQFDTVLTFAGVGNSPFITKSASRSGRANESLAVLHGKPGGLEALRHAIWETVPHRLPDDERVLAELRARLRAYLEREYKKKSARRGLADDLDLDVPLAKASLDGLLIQLPDRAAMAAVVAQVIEDDEPDGDALAELRALLQALGTGDKRCNAEKANEPLTSNLRPPDDKHSESVKLKRILLALTPLLFLTVVAILVVVYRNGCNLKNGTMADEKQDLAKANKPGNKLTGEKVEAIAGSESPPVEESSATRDSADSKGKPADAKSPDEGGGDDTGTDVPIVTPKERKVRITTSPPGATITIDGKNKGLTTPRVLQLAVGKKYDIEVSLQGYKSKRKPQIVSKYGTRIVNVEFGNFEPEYKWLKRLVIVPSYPLRVGSDCSGKPAECPRSPALVCNKDYHGSKLFFKSASGKQIMRTCSHENKNITLQGTSVKLIENGSKAVTSGWSVCSTTQAITVRDLDSYICCPMAPQAEHDKCKIGPA